MRKNYLFTSESVTEGHPDKVADQISDAVLDAIIADDQQARVACETFVTTGLALVSGEISTDCYVNIPEICRQTIKEIGYDRAKYGFDGDTCAVVTSIDEQSPDIARGVDASGKDELDMGAGDQGLMFGYACNETEELMPLPISLAHKLARKLSEVRKNELLTYLRPDGKTQVTVEYHNDRPVFLKKVLVSAQHHPDIEMGKIKRDIIDKVIKDTVPEDMINEDTEFMVNPTGRFVIGGPQGDTGLTGRKIIIDTYGGMARHGGGAFSGKDPTKVDRSAAYAARYVAKNIVAAGLADKCEVQLSYAIGVAHPFSIDIETFDTARIDQEKILQLVENNFDLRPAAIIKKFALRRPIYKQISVYGHFGRPELNLAWEKTDLSDSLKKQAGI